MEREGGFAIYLFIKILLIILSIICFSYVICIALHTVENALNFLKNYLIHKKAVIIYSQLIYFKKIGEFVFLKVSTIGRNDFSSTKN